MNRLGFRVGLSLAFVLAARLTHADAPKGRYTNTVAGIVYDTKTKLSWQQLLAPGDAGDAATQTWSGAVSYCSTLSLNGGGWRLPTINELLTLVDFTKTVNTTAPVIDPIFTNTPGNVFLSSTPLVGSSATHVVVNFHYGNTGAAADTASNYFRCVR